MPGITISAAYGAGGSTIAPRVAERLGLTFLDRAITSSVAERLHLPVEVDPARDAYIKRLYHRSAEDSDLYHLQVDSTALPLDVCVDVIVEAYPATRQPA